MFLITLFPPRIYMPQIQQQEIFGSFMTNFNNFYFSTHNTLVSEGLWVSFTMWGAGWACASCREATKVEFL